MKELQKKIWINIIWMLIMIVAVIAYKYVENKVVTLLLLLFIGGYNGWFHAKLEQLHRLKLAKNE
jgi:hypothetical protein